MTYVESILPEFDQEMASTAKCSSAFPRTTSIGGPTPSRTPSAGTPTTCMARGALLWVILPVSCLCAAADEAKTDQEAVQGKWRIVSFIFNGQPMAEDTYKDLRLEIKGDKYLITEGGATASRTFKLDPTKKPKAMDVTYDDGPNKGKTNHAIYALEGDILTICRHQHPEMERPKDFTAKAGSDRALIKWKRVK